MDYANKPFLKATNPGWKHYDNDMRNIFTHENMEYTFTIDEKTNSVKIGFLSELTIKQYIPPMYQKVFMYYYNSTLNQIMDDTGVTCMLNALACNELTDEFIKTLEPAILSKFAYATVGTSSVSAVDAKKILKGVLYMVFTLGPMAIKKYNSFTIIGLSDG